MSLQAVYEGRLHVVRKLLTDGADPNCIQPCTGPWAATHWAMFGKQERHVQARILAELKHHQANFDLGTMYPRAGTPRGSPAALPLPAPRPFQRPLRLWGLWLTLDERTNCSGAGATPAQWVDLSCSPVSRIKWAMMHHHSLALWQVRCPASVTGREAVGGGVRCRWSLEAAAQRPGGPSRAGPGVVLGLRDGGGGMRAKSVYLKWASHFWFCIQNFIVPSKFFLVLGGLVGGPPDHPSPPPPKGMNPKAGGGGEGGFSHRSIRRSTNASSYTGEGFSLNDAL